jgi:hypothetical protein
MITNLEAGIAGTSTPGGLPRWSRKWRSNRQIIVNVPLTNMFNLIFMKMPDVDAAPASLAALETPLWTQ